MFKSSRRKRRLKRRCFRRRDNRSRRRAPFVARSAFLRRCFNFVFIVAPFVARRRVSSSPLPERFYMQFSEILAALAQFAKLLPSDAQQDFQQTLDSLTKSYETLKQGREHDKQILQFIQFVLGNLRLDAKYLMFDLEATRRENARLNELLDTFLNNER
jgi:hypothetical protein